MAKSFKSKQQKSKPHLPRRQVLKRMALFGAGGAAASVFSMSAAAAHSDRKSVRLAENDEQTEPEETEQGPATKKKAAKRKTKRKATKKKTAKKKATKKKTTEKWTTKKKTVKKKATRKKATKKKAAKKKAAKENPVSHKIATEPSPDEQETQDRTPRLDEESEAAPQ